MKDLYTQLEENERTEDELTLGDSIATQFYYGNFSDAVQTLRENNITAMEFVDFLEDRAEEQCSDLSNIYGGHFSPTFFVCLGSEQL